MKASLLLSLLAASLFLSACETRVVATRPVTHRRVVFATAPSHRVVYRDDRYRRGYYDDRVAYRDSRYRRGYYGDDRVVYRTYGTTNRDYPRRSVDRTYGF